jgi:hypothetical protein
MIRSCTRPMRILFWGFSRPVCVVPISRLWCTATLRVKRAMRLSDKEGRVREVANKSPTIKVRAAVAAATDGRRTGGG